MQTAAEVWLSQPTTSPAAALLRRCCHGPLPRQLSVDVLGVADPDPCVDPSGDTDMATGREFCTAFLDAVLCHADATLTAHLVVATIGDKNAIRAIAHALTNRELQALLVAMAMRGRAFPAISRIFSPASVCAPVAAACAALAGVRPKPVAAHAVSRPRAPQQPVGHTVCTLARAAHRPLRPKRAVDALGGNVGALRGAPEWFADTGSPKRRRTALPVSIAGLGASLDLAIMPNASDTEAVCMVCATCRATRTPILGLPTKRKRSGIVVDVIAGRQLCGHCESDTLVPIRLKHSLIVHRGSTIGGCTRCSKSFVGTGACASCTDGRGDAPCFARCRTKAITTPFVATAKGRLRMFYACPRHRHCIPSTVEDIGAIATRFGVVV